MSTALDPIISEFTSQEQADSYDRWFRAKVEGSLRLADDVAAQRFSTDEVVRRVDQVIKAAQAKHASRRLA